MDKNKFININKEDAYYNRRRKKKKGNSSSNNNGSIFSYRRFTTRYDAVIVFFLNVAIISSSLSNATPSSDIAIEYC